MTLLIEDYALIGNNATAALVGRNGSIDWLCFPRFDSPACFAALLGSPDNGHWSIAPKATHPKITRRYREGTLVLETEFSTAEGTVVLIDCMDRRDGHQDVIRLVRGIRGHVPMQMELTLRFDYGTVVPWVRHLEGNRLCAVAGPDRVVFGSTVAFRGEDFKTRADFEVEEGQTVSFALTWSHSFDSLPSSPNAAAVIENVTDDFRRVGLSGFVRLRSKLHSIAVGEFARCSGPCRAFSSCCPESFIATSQQRHGRDLWYGARYQQRRHSGRACRA
jgi:GH15 family glucan-1,4-alpha-glucosidase